MVLLSSVRISRVPTYSGYPRPLNNFAYGPVTLFRCAFQHYSAIVLRAFRGPYPAHIAICGLGFSDFARHYFRNRFYFLFLRVLRCFSSPGSPHTPMDSVYDNAALPALSSLIRTSADLGSFAAPRRFSQLVTSFFGAMYQGILRKLFVAWSVFSSFLQKFYYFYSANLFLAALQTVKIVLRYFCINLLALLFFLNMKNFAFRTRLSPFFQKKINFSLAMQLWIFGFPFRQKGASS